MLINWIWWIFPIKIGTYPPSKIITLCRVYNIIRGFPYITTVRFGGLHVSSNRIVFVREIIISYYSTSLGTLQQMKSEFKKKKLAFLKVPGVITFKKRFSKCLHNIVIRIDINFTVVYLHVFNIFLMNSWYAERSRSHQVSEKTRSPHRTFQPMN